MPTYQQQSPGPLRLIRTVRLATSQTSLSLPPVTQNQIWPRADRTVVVNTSA